MKIVTVPSSAVVFVMVCATIAPAQSLGEVARQEEARRKAVKTSGKVYTNDSLRREPAPTVTPPPAGQTAQPSQPAQPPSTAPAPVAGQPVAGTPPAGGAAAAAEPPKDEASWRKRIATAREALSRAQIFAEALQTRINALSTDFVNRDDPAQRNIIAADREKALAELARVQQEIQQHQKAIVAIQDEARRAGVPSGWVR